jgi:16S rRNA (adenine1518-N6/adenine1519-N6)-dimethyltransferase
MLFRLLELHRSTGRLLDATLMLQREVADRIVAGPGSRDYGALSILVRLDADASRLLTVPPGAFRPVPKVYSAVVRFRFRSPEVPVRDRTLVVALIRSIFAHRRKTLANALKAFAGSRGLEAARVLHDAAIDPGKRPETLDLMAIARLAETVAALTGRSVV